MTLNSDCLQACSVTVQFGTEPISGGSCDIQANSTREKLLSPGNNATFSVEAGSVIRASDERYCYHISPCGQDGEFFYV